MAKAKLNGMAVVTVSDIEWTNKAGGSNKGIIMQPLCGKIPNKRVIFTTIAQNMMFVPGFSYLVSFTESEPSAEFGREFNWANAGRVAPLEVLEFQKALGGPSIIDVDEPSETAANQTGNELNAEEKLKLENDAKAKLELEKKNLKPA